MKRLLSLVLAGILMLMMAGCGYRLVLEPVESNSGQDVVTNLHDDLGTAQDENLRGDVVKNVRDDLGTGPLLTAEEVAAQGVPAIDSDVYLAWRDSFFEFVEYSYNSSWYHCTGMYNRDWSMLVESLFSEIEVYRDFGDFYLKFQDDAEVEQELAFLTDAAENASDDEERVACEGFIRRFQEGVALIRSN